MARQPSDGRARNQFGDALDEWRKKTAQGARLVIGVVR